MKVAALAKIVPLVLAAGGVLLLGQWLLLGGRAEATLRIPGADRSGPVAEVKATDMHGALVTFDSLPANTAADMLAGSWPRFRGANFDNVSAQALSAAWPKAGPAKIWEVTVGEGYAGAAVHKGRVYLLDYDQEKRTDVLRCLSLATGKDLWDRSYPADVKRNHGMSRTVPAVTDEYVVTLGPKCDVLCADAASGEFRWGIDLVAEYHTKVPPWYAGQCPMIDEGRAIIAPGAPGVLMIAVDCATGKVLWKTPNPRNWEMTHSSIMPLTWEGQRMYVYCASGGVVGVSAKDGAILWQTNLWKVNMASVPSPVMAGDGRILLSGGYGAGCMMLRLKKEGGSIVAEPAYRLGPAVFGSEQQTPIFWKGNIYGVIPGGQLVCLDPETGKPLWNSGSQRFGIGPYLLVNDMLFLLNDTGMMTVAQATTEGYRQVAQWTALEHGHESWGPMALAGGRLLARDFKRLACFDLKEPGHE